MSGARRLAAGLLLLAGGLAGLVYLARERFRGPLRRAA